MEDEEARTIGVPCVWGKGVLKQIFDVCKVIFIEIGWKVVVVEGVTRVHGSPHMDAITCWTVRRAKD